jgi:hypothetical protein
MHHNRLVQGTEVKFGKRVENAIVDAIHKKLIAHVAIQGEDTLLSHEFKTSEYDDKKKGVDLRMISETFPPIDYTIMEVDDKDKSENLNRRLEFPEDGLTVSYGIRTGNAVRDFETPVLIISVRMEGRPSEFQIAESYMKHFDDISFTGAYLYNERLGKNKELIGLITDEGGATCGLPAQGMTRSIKKWLASSAGKGKGDVTYYPLVNPTVNQLGYVIDDKHDIVAAALLDDNQAYLMSPNEMESLVSNRTMGNQTLWMAIIESAAQPNDASS